MFMIILILAVCTKTISSEAHLPQENVNGHLNPINDYEQDHKEKEQEKRTIFSNHLGWAKHVGVHPAGFKYVIGYGPVELKRVPVVKPVSLRLYHQHHHHYPLKHYHVRQSLIKPVIHHDGWKPIIKPVYVNPIQVPVKPVQALPVKPAVEFVPSKPLIPIKPVHHHDVADHQVLQVPLHLAHVHTHPHLHQVPVIDNHVHIPHHHAHVVNLDPHLHHVHVAPHLHQVPQVQVVSHVHQAVEPPHLHQVSHVHTTPHLHQVPAINVPHLHQVPIVNVEPHLHQVPHVHAAPHLHQVPHVHAAPHLHQVPAVHLQPHLHQVPTVHAAPHLHAVNLEPHLHQVPHVHAAPHLHQVPAVDVEPHLHQVPHVHAAPHLHQVPAVDVEPHLHQVPHVHAAPHLHQVPAVNVDPHLHHDPQIYSQQLPEEPVFEQGQSPPILYHQTLPGDVQHHFNQHIHHGEGASSSIQFQGAIQPGHTDLQIPVHLPQHPNYLPQEVARPSITLETPFNHRK